MKAIILCGGYATRLYPLTLDKPKALLPIKGKPLINHILEKISGLNLKTTFIVTNDKFYNNFIWWLNQNTFKNLEILNDGTTDNETRLGSIGDLGFVLDNEDINDDLLILNGDNLLDFDLREIADFFSKKKSAVNGFHVLDREECKKHGVLELDIDGTKILSFEEKPKNPRSNFASIGVYFFPREKINKIKEFCKNSTSKDATGMLVKYFVENDTILGYECGDVIDIGTPETYKKACEQI